MVYQYSDTLSFSSSGASPQSAATGPTSWQMKTLYLGAGSQPLQWTFRRSPFNGSSQNVGWLDQVGFIPGETAPFITSFTGDQSVPAGTNVVLAVAVAGTPPFGTEWQFNGTNLDGQTNLTLALDNVQAAAGGAYGVVITNGYGLVSSNLLLAINPMAPTLIVQPTNQAVWDRSNATFQVAAQGSMPFNYQWRFNGPTAPLRGPPCPAPRARAHPSRAHPRGGSGARGPRRGPRRRRRGAEGDPGLLEDFVAGRESPPERLRAALRAAVIAGRATPVLCGSAFSDGSAALLLDAVADYLPAPEEAARPEGTGSRDRRRPVVPGPGRSLLGPRLQDRRRPAFRQALLAARPVGTGRRRRQGPRRRARARSFA